MKNPGGFLFLIALICYSVIAESAMTDGPDDLPDPYSLFVEAEGEVQQRLHEAAPPGATAMVWWIDRQRIIYATRELNGWMARKDELSKIVVYNVDSGVVEDTPYRGDLLCVSPDGDLLVQDYPVPETNSAFRLPGHGPKDSQLYLHGKFGGKLELLARREGQTINQFSCRFYGRSDYPSKPGYYPIPLRGADGLLFIEDAFAHHTTVHLSIEPSMPNAWSIENDAICRGFGSITYLPWLSIYFSNAPWGNVAPGCMDLNRNSWLFSIKGIEAKPLPRLIQEMRRTERRIGGNGSTYWARRGMYVSVQYSSRGLEGLYRVDESSGQLKRVRRKPMDLNHLSPDGCRNATVFRNVYVIDLCKGEPK